MTMNVIAKTAAMREREFATQVLSPQHLNPDHARIGNLNVTTANAFENHGYRTMNVIAKTAVMREREFATKVLSPQHLNPDNARMGNGNVITANAFENHG